MKLILKTIQIISIIVLSMGFLGCQEDEKEFPVAFAEFTYTVNQETGVVKFINTSRNATIFNWSFGDQTSSSEVNPSHIYQPGTYLVSLVAKNIAGSFRIYQDTIIIGGDNNTGGGGGSTDCTAEASENIDPANGDLNWTFKTNDASHTFEAFGNTAGSIVENPVVDDVNSSCYVEQFVKASGCETWSGLGNELATAIDFTSSTTNKVFKMKVLAENQSADVTLRLERLPYPDTDPAVERVASVTTVGAWQELTFDFSDVTTGTYKSMILYFERNASCDGDIYYFDDIMQVESTGGGGITECTPETTENIDPANGDLNWTFMTNDVNHTFEAFGITAGSIVDNPVLDAVNSSCNVEQFVKASGCETWSGLGFALATAIDFTSSSTNKAFKMKVLSENQVADVTLRLERLPYPDTDPAIERVASITQVGAWQELTFDFSDVTTGTYKSMILYFERNASCDGDVYYFDDIIQVAGSGGTGNCPAPPSGELLSNGGFEDNSGDGSCWQFNSGGGTSAVSTTEVNTGTYAAKLITGANQTPNIKMERFASTIAAGTTVQVTFKYKFTTALGTGSILQVLAFSEKITGAVEHNLGNASDQPLNTWNTFTNTFVTSGDIVEGISLLLQLTGSGNADGGGVVYIDDVQVKQL